MPTETATTELEPETCFGCGEEMYHNPSCSTVGCNMMACPYACDGTCTYDSLGWGSCESSVTTPANHGTDQPESH